MLKAKLALLGAPLVTLFALAFVGPAAAAPSQPFTGSSVVTSVTGTTRNAGGNAITDFVATLASTGTFTGTLIGSGHQIDHPDGTGEQHTNYTATGTTPCGTGSFRIVVNGPFSSDGIQTGHFTSIDNAANTMNIHVDVDFVFDGSTGVATFSGSYRCI
jgi:hypothetical protein